MKQREAYQKFAICFSVVFVLCIVIELLRIFLFTGILLHLFLYFFLVPLGVVLLLVYCIQYRKVFWKKTGSLIAVILCVLSTAFFISTFSFNKIDMMKYQIYQKQYQEAVEIIKEDIADMEDTYKRRSYENEGKIAGIIGKREIIYNKYEDNILINFEMEKGSYRSISYFEGEEILDYLESPGKYSPRLREDKIYKAKYPLKDSNWMYIIW